MTHVATGSDSGSFFDKAARRARWILEIVWANRASLRYGLRLWLSICLALYIAFWLQLDEPYWAGTSAGVACLPQLGSVLRKGWFRVVGTFAGAVGSLALAALFPQNRGSFLFVLAVWGAACAFLSSLLRNFAAYGAALAGFTVAIIAGGALGATGGVNSDVVFHLAVARSTEICIGVFSAGIIGIIMDVGDAPHRASTAFASVSARIMNGFLDTLTRDGAIPLDMRPVRRELIKQSVALDPLTDQAIGESSQIRSYAALLQRGIDGLFGALIGWRTVAADLDRLSAEERSHRTKIILNQFPPVVIQATAGAHWTGSPERLRMEYQKLVQRLMDLQTETPSTRLLADKTAEVFASMIHTLVGLELLTRPGRPGVRRASKRFRVPDYLPALVNAARAFITIGAVSVFWIATGWTNGVGMITFAMSCVILFGPQGAQAYTGMLAFTAGAVGGLFLAAIVLFGVLPGVPATFLSLALVIGACLVPLGTLSVRRLTPWQAGMVNTMMLIFIPLLAPTNPMNYNAAAFFNSGIAIILGCFAGVYSFTFIPPLSPAYQSRRLLALTLRDFQSLAAGRSHSDWNGHILGRLTAMPESSMPLQRARLLAALSAGSEIVQLRELANYLDLSTALALALNTIADRDSSRTVASLADVDGLLAARSQDRPSTQTVSRMRGSILALSETLEQHADYFDGGVLE